MLYEIEIGIRQQAEQFLQQCEENSYEEFILALVGEASRADQSIHVRTLSALQIKNLLKAEDPGIKRVKLAKWNACSPQTQENVRVGLLQALVTAVAGMAKPVASAIAVLASIEVPMGGWPALLQTLFANVSSPDVSIITKVASLETLGFTCESIEVNDVPKHIVDQILNTVVSGMAAEQDDKIKLAAVEALTNSLYFTERNFTLDKERDAIMSAVFTTAQCDDLGVRKAAFECLAKIASEYYVYLNPYMEKLFALTSNAIMVDDEEVKKMALEFWTSIFEAEAEEDPSVSLHIGAHVVVHLVPLILQTLTLQTDIDDDDDENNWDIVAAGQVCLQALADVVESTMVEHVMPFVTSNIQGEWRQKDAAIFAFGVLIAYATEQLLAYVQASVQLLLNGMQGEKTRIRDTCAWTLGQILQHQRESITPQQVHTILECLLNAVDDASTAVSRQSINSLLNYASSFGDDEEDEEEEPQSNGLSPYLQGIVTKLLTISANHTCKVKVEAYEAASVFIENSALDQTAFILQVLTEAIARLEVSFNSVQDINDRATLQSLICGVINNCFIKLPAAAITDVVDRGMENLLKVLNFPGPSAQEEAFMAIGFIADKLGVGFERYTAHVSPYLIGSLRNPDEHAVFTPTITAVSAICKSCIKSLLPFTDDIMKELLMVLQSPTVERSLKPAVIGVFCDMSMNMGGDFERYLESVLGVLRDAQAMSIPENSDEETLEFMNQLYISMFEAYTGITHGLYESGKIGLLEPYIDSIFCFISNVVQNEDVSDELLNSAIGLIGDLARDIGAPLLQYVTQPVIQTAVREANSRGGKANDTGLRETANYTTGFIEQIRMGCK